MTGNGSLKEAKKVSEAQLELKIKGAVNAFLKIGVVNQDYVIIKDEFKPGKQFYEVYGINSDSEFQSKKGQIIDSKWAFKKLRYNKSEAVLAEIMGDSDAGATYCLTLSSNENGILTVHDWMMSKVSNTSQVLDSINVEALIDLAKEKRVESDIHVESSF